MVYIAKIAINTDELHCKRYFDVDHRTIRPSGMPTLLAEVFQWFVNPFYCVMYILDLHYFFHHDNISISVFFRHFPPIFIHLLFAKGKHLKTNIPINLFAWFFFSFDEKSNLFTCKRAYSVLHWTTQIALYFVYLQMLWNGRRIKC